MDKPPCPKHGWLPIFRVAEFAVASAHYIRNVICNACESEVHKWILSHSELCQNHRRTQKYSHAIETGQHSVSWANMLCRCTLLPMQQHAFTRLLRNSGYYLCLLIASSRTDIRIRASASCTEVHRIVNLPLVFSGFDRSSVQTGTFVFCSIASTCFLILPLVEPSLQIMIWNCRKKLVVNLFVSCCVMFTFAQDCNIYWCSSHCVIDKQFHRSLQHRRF